MRFGQRLKTFFSGKKIVDDIFFDELSDLLIEGDFGAARAALTVKALRETCKREDINLIPEKLALSLEEELRKASRAADPVVENDFTAILLLGVNGAGKTTTAAKLAFLYNAHHEKNVILAAADTFRAAAIDQLKSHGEKLNIRVVAHRQGGDPAAVVYDALESALSAGSGLVIADTAGRMHTKSALVEELRKIDRVVERKFSEFGGKAGYLKYLVLDATTGRNAYAQAEIFHDAVTIDGVILTKYDSTAKGGVVFSLASDLRLPVSFICAGEKYEDIEFFDPKKFSREFVGIE